MEDAYSAFFLISKVLCFCFGLNSGLTFAAVIRHYYKSNLKEERGLFPYFCLHFQVPVHC